MKIEIQKYRDFKIQFDIESETFSCVVTDGGKESKSFKAVKQFVDEYIKENNIFEPFNVVTSPYSYKSKQCLTIIGIRKDNLFIAKNKKGEKITVSKYDEDSYILDITENEQHFIDIAFIESEISDAQKRLKSAKEKVTAPTLKELKQKYQQQ